MRRIIFFDGICPLCNGFINYIFQHDKKRNFMYAPLQSKCAEQMLNPEDRRLDSIVFIEDKKIYKKSAAVLRIMFHLSGLWSILTILFAVVPPFIRDLFYDTVANNCYKIFGKFDSCRIPTEEEKKYFLD